jgi:hypothetical protein
MNLITKKAIYKGYDHVFDDIIHWYCLQIVGLLKDKVLPTENILLSSYGGANQQLKKLDVQYV